MKHTLLSLAVLAAFGVSHAATLTVDPTAADAAVAGDAKCSLREAVLSVNAGADQGDCLANTTEAYGTHDTITLPAGTYTLTASGLDETYTDSGPADPGVAPVVQNSPDARVGDLDLQKSVRLVGAGAATTIVRWDPAAATPDRLFHVIAATGTVDVAIEGLTLTGGATREVTIKAGPASGALATTYYLRRAGGALAVGPAAAVVLIDPNLTGTTNSEGRGGSQKPGETDPGGATYSLTLTDTVVEGNSAQGDGGGIYTASAMTALRARVRNNTSTVNGGGVYNEGNTQITSSTLSGNTAEGGGGLFATGSNSVRLTGVTLSGNTAVGGGAVSQRAGVSMTLVNTTVSGNMATDVGAGLYTNGTLSLNFVTVADNLSGADAAGAGSGLNTFPASQTANAVTVRNTLMARNRRGWTQGMDATAIAALPSANCGVTGSGLPVSSQGANLSSDTTCNTWLSSGTDRHGLDPHLGELADNGGLTWTHALLAGSPALGAGLADSTVTLDQRGMTRDAVPDIGAYEEPTPVVESSGGGGCTLNPHAGFDPGLLALTGAALAGLLLRRQRRSRR